MHNTGPHYKQHIVHGTYKCHNYNTSTLFNCSLYVHSYAQIGGQCFFEKKSRPNINKKQRQTTKKRNQQQLKTKNQKRHAKT